MFMCIIFHCMTNHAWRSSLLNSTQCVAQEFMHIILLERILRLWYECNILTAVLAEAYTESPMSILCTCITECTLAAGVATSAAQLFCNWDNHRRVKTTLKSLQCIFWSRNPQLHYIILYKTKRIMQFDPKGSCICRTSQGTVVPCI